MKFLAIYSFSMLFLSAFSSSCPSENGGFPCECTEQDDYIEIVCFSREVTMDKLSNVLSVVDKSVTIELVLNEMDLGTVPSNFFAGLNIRKVEIIRCRLIHLSDDSGKPFTGLEDTLEQLIIMASIGEETQITKLELSHLRSLVEVDLSYNAINELGNDWFPDSLTILTLTNNGIQKLGDRAFGNLHNLETLYLDGNRFGAISRSMLPNPADVLEELGLDNNAFTSIPEDLFTNMPTLQTLSLQKNGIRRIEENTFKGIWAQMDFIDVQENPIECDSHMDWISNLETELRIAGICYAPHEKLGVILQNLIKSKM